MTEKIRTLLTQIYGDDAAYADLAALLDRFRERLPPPTPGPLFDEADALLITYGDTLQSPDETPLRTLKRFADAHLHDAFAAVHILPFYPYSSDDGFSVQDFYAVNPDLGDWDDVEALGEHFGLMFDAVFNHMSAQSAWFRAYLTGDPEFAHMFRAEPPDTDLTSVTRPRTSPLLTPFERTDGETVHVWTTFSADQVDIDFRAPSTLLRMLDVLLFYVAKGARIIRLDAIAYMWKVVGTSSIHLPQAHTAIQLMRAALDEVAPDVVLITETNVPHAENVSYFGDGTDEAQMVYNFTLPPLLFHTMLTGDVTKLRAWVNTLTTPSDRTTFFNFTASHDGVGLRPVEGILTDDEIEALAAHAKSTGGRINYRNRADGTSSPYELNVTYVDAVTDPTEPPHVQAKRFLLSQAIAMALAGVPAVYVHSLLGSRNDIAGMERTGHNRTINRAKLQLDDVLAEIENADSFRARVFEPYRALLTLRRKTPAFHPNVPQQPIDVGNAGVFALMRGEGRLLALNNVTGEPQTVNIGTYFAGGATDILTGATYEGEIGLEPYAVLWLQP